tara:strand:- start:291 stop:854 length:564 start_codon:yes stop_codon:yes gene_type:complete
MVISNETENYYNLENPFTCNSKYGVRIGLGKDPRHNKKCGHENIFQAKNESNGNTYLINPTDDKMTYTIGTGEEKQMTDISKYDLEVPAEVLNEARSDGKKLHKDGLPLSFIQITTEEEGVEWYKLHYPKIPDDLLPIIARYHWGEPITKKGIKNEKKKIRKKQQKQMGGLEYKKAEEGKSFEITFD